MRRPEKSIPPRRCHQASKFGANPKLFRPRLATSSIRVAFSLWTKLEWREQWKLLPLEIWALSTHPSIQDDLASSEPWFWRVKATTA